jgi:hypothetical protein
MIALICWVREYVVRNVMHLQGDVCRKDLSAYTESGTIKVNAFFPPCGLRGIGSGGWLRYPHRELSWVWQPLEKIKIKGRQILRLPCGLCRVFLKLLPHREHKSLVHFYANPHLYAVKQSMCASSNLRDQERQALPVFMQLPGKGRLHADHQRDAVWWPISRHHFTESYPRLLKAMNTVDSHYFFVDASIEVGTIWH